MTEHQYVDVTTVTKLIRPGSDLSQRLSTLKSGRVIASHVGTVEGLFELFKSIPIPGVSNESGRNELFHSFYCILWVNLVYNCDGIDGSQGLVEMALISPASPTGVASW